MKRLTLIAAVIPLLGFFVLVGRAEYASRHGPTWRVPIDGYDPRDLLHGHYLRYQYQWRWTGEDSCGAEPMQAVRTLDPDCCLCLQRTNPEGINPLVHQIWCEDSFESETCDGIVRVDAVMPPLRYFVPEDRALELERELTDRRAELELTIGPDQRPAVRELWLDGRPWREQLDD